MAYDRQLEKLRLERDFYKDKYDREFNNIFTKDKNYRNWKNAYDALTKYLKKNYPERYATQLQKSKKLANKKPEVRMGDWCETFEEYAN